MKIENETRYPSRKVRAILDDAMGRRSVEEDRILVRVLPLPKTASNPRRGSTTNPHTGQPEKSWRWHVRLMIGPPSDFPVEQVYNTGKRSTANEANDLEGAPSFTLRDWVEGLYQMAAHESYHVWNGDESEVNADRYGLRKLRGMRIRRALGLTRF